jgi:hypothetical protein
LPVGRMETTVDRQNHSVDKDGVLTCEKCNHTRDFIGCGGPADREAVKKSRHHCFTFSSSAVASVEVRLGATALIRTPREPYSSARARVKFVTAPFAAL